MPSATTPPRAHQNLKLTTNLRAMLGLPPDRSRGNENDHAQARALLPGWAIEVREAAYPRVKGWWPCALDRAANHGGRPLLIYKINDQPWRAILAVRDLSPALATTPPQLTTEMDLQAFAAVVRAQQGHCPGPRSVEALPKTCAGAETR